MAYFTYKLLKMKIFKKSNKVQKSPIKSGLIHLDWTFCKLSGFFATLIKCSYTVSKLIK